MDSIRDAVTKELAERNVELEPTFPRILVRVIPKAQVSKGGIILTDHEQNKPVHEGLVIKTYKPFWNRYKMTTVQDLYNKSLEDWLVVRSPMVILDEDKKVKAVWQESEVQPGDHVIFPYMAPGITPVWPLDDGKGNYRLIEEGHILAVLRYKTESTSQWLRKLVNKVGGLELQDGGVDEMVAVLLKNADVIRKDVTSKTLSGA
jgi:hypothetical protein